MQFYSGEDLVKTHAKATTRRKTDLADLPAEKTAFYARNPEWCFAKAAEIGPAALAAVHEILSVNTLYNLRQAQGIVRLAERYGALRVNAAAERAASYGDPRYMTIRTILEKGLERVPSQSAAPLIRDLSTCGYLERKESVLLYGPVGVGKSHIAQALGHAA